MNGIVAKCFAAIVDADLLPERRAERGMSARPAVSDIHCSGVGVGLEVGERREVERARRRNSERLGPSSALVVIEVAQAEVRVPADRPPVALPPWAR